MIDNMTHHSLTERVGQLERQTKNIFMLAIMPILLLYIVRCGCRLHSNAQYQLVLAFNQQKIAPDAIPNRIVAEVCKPETVSLVRYP